ncbi:hypothetical protein QNI16_34245 [Cytophagaceae bacterium YF14B1]|uniref:Uncharacterized protein n=1 Tax=Xanthocytophaga flava TaxID=3048013 RepID=A0AAE3QUF0_9BACT|nr:hypothetical protein [Xanthocytophaga flavus]MDJ1485602.1 hypothetical protein [Xanthocytophaga flavus]
MTKKKFFLDKKSRQTRKRSLDELKENNIEIQDDESIQGGAVDRPGWIEIPIGDDGPDKK